MYINDDSMPPRDFSDFEFIEKNVVLIAIKNGNWIVVTLLWLSWICNMIFFTEKNVCIENLNI